MTNVIIQESMTLIDYLNSTNRLNSICSCCGRRMFSDEAIELFNEFKVFPSNKRGIELRRLDKSSGKFNFCQEPNEYKWALIGISSSTGERYFRDVCWDCFKTNLRNRATDGKHLIPCNTKKNSWWMRTIKGEDDAYPEGKASAIGKYWADLMFTSLSEEQLKSISSKFDTASLESFKKRFGDVQGQLKYEEYVKFHSEKNTFEYKHEHLGWSKEQFDEFNKNRGVTLNLCIKKHGDELGRKIFAEYCDKQAYAGCKLEYFIEKYGEDEGRLKYDEVCSSKSVTQQRYIDKYGYEEGCRRWDEKINNLMASSSGSWSKISQKLFDEVLIKIPKCFWKNVHYETFNGGEVSIKGSTHMIYPDFIMGKKIIEFNGDYWHKNPKIYSESDEGVKDTWEYDKNRLSELKSLGYDVLVVWEMDYKNNPNDVVSTCLTHLQLP